MIDTDLETYVVGTCKVSDIKQHGLFKASLLDSCVPQTSAKAESLWQELGIDKV